MRIIECDRCHKRFNKDTKKTGYVKLDQWDINTGALDGNSEFDDWDICPDRCPRTDNIYCVGVIDDSKRVFDKIQGCSEGVEGDRA